MGSIGTMLTYSEFMKRLAPMQRADVIALAQRAGVSPHTLIKVWTRDTGNPGVLLVEKVSRHLERVDDQLVADGKIAA